MGFKDELGVWGFFGWMFMNSYVGVFENVGNMGLQILQRHCGLNRCDCRHQWKASSFSFVNINFTKMNFSMRYYDLNKSISFLSKWFFFKII